MTQFDDPLKQGRAYFARALIWGTNNQFSPQFPTTGDQQVDTTEIRGIPHSQTITYELGAASTALASGVVSITTPTGGSLTATGALVTASVATFDVPRAIRITASGDFSSNVFTIVGTDGYGQPMSVKMLGATGNTLGSNGSFVFSPAAFKTINSPITQTGTGAAAGVLQIGTADVYGLPHRIANVGKFLAINVNGVFAATAGFATTAAGNTSSGTGGVVGPVFPGFAATGTHTASSADVRGMFGLPTTNAADGTKRITVHFISPTVGITEAADTKENSYGLTPATG